MLWIETRSVFLFVLVFVPLLFVCWFGWLFGLFAFVSVLFLIVRVGYPDKDDDGIASVWYLFVLLCCLSVVCLDLLLVFCRRLSVTKQHRGKSLAPLLMDAVECMSVCLSVSVLRLVFSFLLFTQVCFCVFAQHMHVMQGTDR